MSEHIVPRSYITSAFGLIALFVIAMAFLTIPMRQIMHAEESLADATTLTQLIHGTLIEQPQEPSLDAIFHEHRATAPSLSSLNHVAPILGMTTTNATKKRIEVDLTNQKVYAFEGDTKVYTFIVSTGKWGWTPTGEFTIWAKVKSQLMKGGSKERGTYYYLPNVPWVMFFSNDQVAKMRGFSFHGTYWHDKFGTPQSHGCINMKTEEAKILYDWATPVVTNPKAWSTLSRDDNPGTTVVIYGETPKS